MDESGASDSSMLNATNTQTLSVFLVFRVRGWWGGCELHAECHKHVDTECIPCV